MAMNLSSDEGLGLNAEINVTPFIDVILVLLIIFMVAAPISTVDVPVDLPTAVAKPEPRKEKLVYVTLKPDLSLAMGEENIPWERLGSAVDVAARLNHDTRLFIRADKSVSYGDIMRLFNHLRANGYLKVALVGLQGEEPAPSKPVAP